MVSVDDRAAEMGDEVTLDFEGFLAIRRLKAARGEDFQLKLGSGQFIPGFEEQVAGHKIDEDFDVTVTFPGRLSDDRLCGARKQSSSARFTPSAKEEIPELTDDFVKEISDFDTVDEMEG